MGLRPLKEVNTVCCLKLICRIVSLNPSLSVKWVQTYLIKKGMLWSVRDNRSTGSWMWRKILKYRALARNFQRVGIRNGESTSFWFDIWSDKGCLIELTGPRGVIDMPLNAYVASLLSRRRRWHFETI